MEHQANPQLANKKLYYPFGKRWSPEPGVPFEVADGVYWLRMPLPIALDHINLWILKDEDDLWTIVDTGYDAQECKDVWNKVFNEFLAPDKVKQIIVTHFHPDHIGLAAWLSHRCDAPILISKGEFNHYHDIVTRDAKQFNEKVNTFATEVGFSAEMKQSLMSFFSSSGKGDRKRVTHDMCEFIKEGDVLNINGRQWSVVMGNGHSPEHACLYSDELDALISGDQAIARISSNISVYPSNPDANPLYDWLHSCAKLRDKFGDQTLVLAAHQEPFNGIKQRMQAMIEEHHANLEKIRFALVNKLNTISVRQVIFDRELNLIQTVLATGETLAHLNYLKSTQELDISYQQGVAYYQLVSK